MKHIRLFIANYGHLIGGFLAGFFFGTTEILSIAVHLGWCSVALILLSFYFKFFYKEKQSLLKTKLLKQARKRFSILHYPNGMKNEGSDVVVLKDIDCEYYVDRIAKTINLNALPITTLDEAINILKLDMLNTLRLEYPELGSKRNGRVKVNKVWHIIK